VARAESKPLIPGDPGKVGLTKCFGDQYEHVQPGRLQPAAFDGLQPLFGPTDQAGDDSSGFAAALPDGLYPTPDGLPCEFIDTTHY